MNSEERRNESGNRRESRLPGMLTMTGRSRADRRTVCEGESDSDYFLHWDGKCWPWQWKQTCFHLQF
jgi:hypothetical protein